MKYDIAMKWIEALRSGKYQKGTKYLKYNNKFCCLGVLCDISGLSKWNDDNSYLNLRVCLPEKVMEWSGVKTDNGRYNNNLYLSSLNDYAGYSFKEIADIIEEHWEEL